MDVSNDIRTSQTQDVVVTLHQSRYILELLTPEIFFCKLILLDHRAHRTIQHQYALLDGFL